MTYDRLHAMVIERVGLHFRLERMLGSGGMGQVLEVTDERTGRRLALKRLLRTQNTAHDARALAAFRNEYHLLSQIAHPNVVRVEEYGFDNESPFYTMELVEGRPVSELAPLPWARVCSIVLDLCSPLAMLHARRFIHGDISARNVLITAQGVTKLIDFGALSAIDQDLLSRTLTGTPPHMPPELVHRQPIDGRVDVFALGALAYWMLSRRYAYPAREISELPEVWQSGAARLRELGVDLPDALDELILSMLDLEATARPVQMAELVQRLCAITGQSHAVQHSAIRAHVTTPRLVGRDALVRTFGALQVGLAQGRGAVLCVRGARGMGHSRLIDALALEATVAGSLVLRAASESGRDTPFGVVASLVLMAERAGAPNLGALLPGLQKDRIDDVDELAQALSAAENTQTVLAAWWSALCVKYRVVVLVDDIRRADTASLQHLLALTEVTTQPRMLLVATLTESGPGMRDDPLAALLGSGFQESLLPLRQAETQQLLLSIFGDTPHIEQLSEWVQRIAGGVPARCIELAHYVLEHDIVRFEAGRFQIPADISVAGLPRSFEDATNERIRNLSARALELLGALSLVTRLGALSASQHVELMDEAGWSQEDRLSAVDELLDAQLVLSHPDGYELRAEAVRRRVQLQMDPALERAWQARLGAVYERHGHARRMLAAWHYLLAGQADRADMLKRALEVQGPADPNMAIGDSEIGVALHERLLEHVLATKASNTTVAYYRKILLNIGAMSNPALGVHGPALIARLRFDTGLDLWDSCAADPDEHSRLLACFKGAHERHLSMPEAERGFPVLEAVGETVQSAFALSSIYLATFDGDAVSDLAALIRPLRTLAPVVALCCELVECTALRLTLGASVTERLLQALQGLETKPEGMPDYAWGYVRGLLHFRVGHDRAAVGDPACFDNIEYLRSQERLVPYAVTLQLFYALAQGDFSAAQRLRRERSIAMLASGHEDQHLAAAQLLDLKLSELCGDLLELQRLCSWFDERARRFPRWRSIAACARAQYLIQCGEFAAAQQLLAQTVSDVPPYRSFYWYELRTVHAEATLLAGDVALAEQLSREALALADTAGCQMPFNTRPHRVLALASAALGDHARALAVLEPLLQYAEAEPVPTVHGGRIFETAAQVSLQLGQGAEYDRYLARVSEIYRRGKHPGLAARIERLKAAGRRARREAATPDAKQPSINSEMTTKLIGRMQAELVTLADDDKPEYLLSVVLNQCAATAGLLFRRGSNGEPKLLAARGVLLDPDLISQRMRSYLTQLFAADLDVRTETETEAIDMEFDHGYLPVPLRDSQRVVQGVALLGGASREHLTAPALWLTIAEALAAADVRGRETARPRPLSWEPPC